MRHCLVRLHFLKERHEAGEVVLRHISTQGNVSDLFTKILVTRVFHGLRQYLIK